MDRVIAVLAAVPLAIVSPPDTDRVAQWNALIAEAALRFGIPEDWIRRVMRAESGGRTTLEGRPVTSVKGAMGLMQVMPATYAEMARRHGLGADPYAPRDNILAGAAYMRAMYDRFGYPGLFAAYNAGPERYAAHLRTGKALPDETRIYLSRITGTPIAPPEARSGLPPPRPRIGVFFVLEGQRAGHEEAKDATAAQTPRSDISGPQEVRESSASSAPRSEIFVQLRTTDTSPR